MHMRPLPELTDLDEKQKENYDELREAVQSRSEESSAKYIAKNNFIKL